jgi:hypothetical protein
VRDSLPFVATHKPKEALLKKAKEFFEKRGA